MDETTFNDELLLDVAIASTTHELGAEEVALLSDERIDALLANDEGMRRLMLQLDELEHVRELLASSDTSAGEPEAKDVVDMTLTTVQTPPSTVRIARDLRLAACVCVVACTSWFVASSILHRHSLDAASTAMISPSAEPEAVYSISTQTEVPLVPDAVGGVETTDSSSEAARQTEENTTPTDSPLLCAKAHALRTSCASFDARKRAQGRVAEPLHIKVTKLQTHMYRLEVRRASDIVHRASFSRSDLSALDDDADRCWFALVAASVQCNDVTSAQIVADQADALWNGEELCLALGDALRQSVIQSVLDHIDSHGVVECEIPRVDDSMWTVLKTKPPSQRSKRSIRPNEAQNTSGASAVMSISD